MHIEEKSILDSLQEYIKSIKYIHFSDSNRQAPGFGNIDYQSIIKIFKQQRFSGVISFEVLPIPDDMTAAEQAIKYIRSLLEKYE
jgi:sugar phosphate isomerase/epimerase